MARPIRAARDARYHRYTALSPGVAARRTRGWRAGRRASGRGASRPRDRDLLHVADAEGDRDRVDRRIGDRVCASRPRARARCDPRAHALELAVAPRAAFRPRSSRPTTRAAGRLARIAAIARSAVPGRDRARARARSAAARGSRASRQRVSMPPLSRCNSGGRTARDRVEHARDALWRFREVGHAAAVITNARRT